jgi:error-prone DNA polymerase
MTPYAELQVTTNFTFLEGASHPEEIIAAAATLGLDAVAITDRNSFAGIVRAHVAAKEAGVRLIIGVRLDLQDAPSLLAYPADRAAYGRLCRLITLGRRRAGKGFCELYRDDVLAHAEGSTLIVLPPEIHVSNFESELMYMSKVFENNIFLSIKYGYHGDDATRMEGLAALAARCRIPTVAVNDVLMHEARRRIMADVLTCIRERCTIDTAGLRLQKNAERHLKSGDAMARLFRAYPEAIAATVEIARRCRFSLDELRYEYPDEITSEGRTVQEELVHLTEIGAKERYPWGVPEKVRRQIDHEYALIGQLGYAPYFLTVHDIVAYARSRDILCQGRGSAANSAVCYCLGITSVDPNQIDLLFERFVSAERDEPPDIDVDFEHERREEVIQYIYTKYGRERAGLAATVIHYRARRAIREVGKAVGLSEDAVGALASQIWGWSKDGLDEDWVRGLGFDPTDSRLRLALDLSAELIGFPRHLSQHVGGFIITRGRLDETVPVENAAMAERTVIEWDKNDLDSLGILKIDVLALGMLTCIRKGFDLIRDHHGRKVELATVPAADPAVYDMLCEADSLGVFQVESRAQMSFLPRMKPRTFYDLVIEVAIVRPGPIQGNMVHPYLRRRNGEEPVAFPKAELAQVLGKTLGVPLFQEQAMKIAIVAAGFSPAEADKLRRAMATFRNTGSIHSFEEKFIGGMTARGYDRDFAERCFRQIEGFGEYGFPESHAASFALLVYVSAWMKRHYPAAFACALLNSQPMGFYAPAQIVRDVRDHGVEVLPIDVNFSCWDCTLEAGGDPAPPVNGTALRLGLRQIKGLKKEDADWLVAARGNGYPDPVSIWRRADVPPKSLAALARADAFGSMELDRRAALWAVKRLKDKPLPLFAAAGEEDGGTEPDVALPAMSMGEQVVADYQTLRLSLKCHPLALLRDGLAGVTAAGNLPAIKDGRRVAVAGLVLVRQRPGTAKGIIFLTLEDETGVSNIVVWSSTYEQFRRAVMMGRMLKIEGMVQKEGIVIHVVADKIEDCSAMLDSLDRAETFAPPYAHADEPSRARSDDARGQKPPRKVLPGAIPTPTKRHPREQAKVLFPSRDFH